MMTTIATETKSTSYTMCQSYCEWVEIYLLTKRGMELLSPVGDDFMVTSGGYESITTWYYEVPKDTIVVEKRFTQLEGEEERIRYYRLQ